MSEAKAKDAKGERKLPPKPVPNPTEPLNKEWWDLVATGTLHFQRCTDCGTWRHLPRPMCAGCGSMNWEWSPSKGMGKIFSWTVTHQPSHPAFFGDAPFAAVIVELDEGVRMLSRVKDLSIEELKLDLPVEVVFEPITNDISLPYFRPRSG